MKMITFPKEEHFKINKRIKENKPIFTLRVSKEQGKYKEGDKLKTGGGALLKVKSIKKIKNISEYKFHKEITKEQKELISKYKKIDLIELIPLKEDQKSVWNSIAPEWHEHKTNASELAKEFLSKQKGNILDIGSGSGRHLQKIKNGKMFLVDFSEKMIKLAKQKTKEQNIDAEFAVANMTKLPYKDNFFDSAICISALHCLQLNDSKKAIKELHRVLKPKTQSLIAVWNKNSKRFRRCKTNEKYIGWTDKGKRYYYLFTENEIHKLFTDADFKIISTHNSELMIRFVVEKN